MRRELTARETGRKRATGRLSIASLGATDGECDEGWSPLRGADDGDRDQVTWPAAHRMNRQWRTRIAVELSDWSNAERGTNGQGSASGNRCGEPANSGNVLDGSGGFPV